MTKILDYEDELEQMYDDMLDEVYPMFMDMYEPSDTLKKIDPIAYSCGKNDYIDSLISDGTVHESGNDEYHEGSEEDCDICNPEEEEGE